MEIQGFCPTASISDSPPSYTGDKGCNVVSKVFALPFIKNIRKATSIQPSPTRSKRSPPGIPKPNLSKTMPQPNLIPKLNLRNEPSNTKHIPNLEKRLLLYQPYNN